MITPFDNSRADLRQRLRKSQFARTEIFASARISGHGPEKFLPPTWPWRTS